MLFLQLLVIKALVLTTISTSSHAFTAVNTVQRWKSRFVVALSKRSQVLLSRRILSRSIYPQTKSKALPSSVLIYSAVNAYDTSSLINSLESSRLASNEYAEQFGLGPAEAAVFGLFSSVRQFSKELLGLRGKPFVLRGRDIEEALQQPTEWSNFFTMQDLEKALTDDFLDAARGSTDNRKGWKIIDVSVPRGESFDEARMTYNDVCQALEKGTVIFNAAGAHIPKLAGPCLAASDATSLPCSLNMYITAPGKRTSAPPHTDKQDVCVIQTEGCKSWKVFSVPDPSLKPSVDVFARGKGDDSLPIHTLSETAELLVETTLYPGDVLFIPAGFPHTTSTVIAPEGDTDKDVTSIHLTFGVDHHIWELDYLSVIRLAYRRAHIAKSVLDVHDDDNSPYSGAVNQLPWNVITEIMAELPLGALENDALSLLDDVADIAFNISSVIDPDSTVDASIIRSTVQRVCQQGVELLDIHRDMYLEALQEGRTRAAEDAMTAHMNSERKVPIMSPERIQRLSLFRVKRFYDKINESKNRLKEWSISAVASKQAKSDAISTVVSVGDKVEAELAGAYFPATITQISETGTYDVTFFDGDRETGLSRQQIKLLSVPKPAEADTSKMTSKQLKRWKKEQEKL